jgi:hypothetical protein
LLEIIKVKFINDENIYRKFWRNLIKKQKQKQYRFNTQKQFEISQDLYNKIIINANIENLFKAIIDTNNIRDKLSVMNSNENKKTRNILLSLNDRKWKDKINANSDYNEELLFALLEDVDFYNRLKTIDYNFIKNQDYINRLKQNRLNDKISIEYLFQW